MSTYVPSACSYDPKIHDVPHPHPGPFPGFTSYRGKLPEQEVVQTLEEMARFHRILAEAFGWKDPTWD